MALKKTGKEASAAKDGHSQEDVPGPKAYLSTIISKVKPKTFKLVKETGGELKDVPLTDKDVRALIAENPNMNAATFYNLLKSKGATITALAATGDEEVTEADSGSAATQVLRSGVKEGPKYDDCVKKVTAKGKVNNAYAVCAASLGTTKEGGPGSGRHPYGKVTVKDEPKRGFGKVIVKDGPATATFTKHESGKFNIKSNRFLEAVKGNTSGVDGNPQSEIVGFTKFKVVLLQEGMGNFRDGYWYSKDALKSAIPVFEGAKIYADHPSKMDEAVRPERTVRDILGNFEDVHLEEADGQRAQLVGTVSILGDESFRWARSLMEHAVEFAKKYPDKEFVGLSINANGDSNEMPIDDLISSGVPDSTLPKLQQAKDEGIDSIKIVTVISDAVSCDLVTEAGAGGKVLQMLEGENMGHKKEKGGTAAPGKVTGKVDDSIDKTHGASVDDEAGAHQTEDGSDDGDAADHDDADQDVALIKQMIKKYMGDGKDDGKEDEEESEAHHESEDEAMGPTKEEVGVVKEAYEAHKEMGYGEEEAAEKAVHQLKFAKHMASKKEAHKQTECEDESEAHHESENESEAHKQNEKHKESMIRLKAENAKLKESLKKIEVNNHVDSLCKKSKLPSHITKSFKEAIGTPKTVEEVNKSWKLFEAGLKKADEELGGFAGLVISPEKETRAAGKSSLFDGVMKD